MNAVWCINAMRHWGKADADALGWPLFAEAYIGECDTVLIEGLYDPPDYGFTLKCTERAKRRWIHWHGTDVQLLMRNKAVKLLPEAVHTCDSELLRGELASLGIIAKVAPPAAVVHAPVKPMPETPVLAVYYGSNAPEKYGSAYVRFVCDALQSEMPDLQLLTINYGDYTPEQMAEVIPLTTCLMRILDHDGSAVSAREWMEAGRYVVTTTDLPHATKVTKADPVGILRAVRNALKKTEPDLSAAEFYSAYNSTQRWLDDVKEVVDAGA